MSLFGIDSQQPLKEDAQIAGAQIAGGALGVGTGYAATLPLDARYRSKLFEQGMKLNEDKEIAKKHWEALIGIAKGEISLEKLPLNQRKFYARMLEEHAEELKFLLKSPLNAKNALGELDRGKVQPLFEGAGKAKIRMDNFPHLIRSPKSSVLPGALGIAGLIGGGVVMKGHLQQQRENKQE